MTESSDVFVAEVGVGRYPSIPNVDVVTEFHVSTLSSHSYTASAAS